MTIPPLPEDWNTHLNQPLDDKKHESLWGKLTQEYASHPICPPREELFQAFEWTPFTEVKALILGQDPYHGPGQAHGLAFSVTPQTPVPPSLKNIYKELEADLGVPSAEHGYLKAWAEQGVLMLNAMLSVRQGEAASHRKLGWENFTDQVIHTLSTEKEAMAFVLWGKFAQSKKKHIDTRKHLVIESAHPSPLGAYRGFWGSHPFSKINQFLTQHQQSPIDWELPTQAHIKEQRR